MTVDDVTSRTKLDEDLEAFEELEGGGPADKEENRPESGVENADAEPVPPGDALGEDLLSDEEESSYDSDELASKGEGDFSSGLAELAADVPVNLVAVIGKIKTNVGQVMGYDVGSVIDFKRPPDDRVDIVANGRLIAKGQLVEVDGKLGVKILRLLK